MWTWRGVTVGAMGRVKSGVVNDDRERLDKIRRLLRLR